MDEQKSTLNLLALLPCPLKVPIQEAFELFVQQTEVLKNKHFQYVIEGNANKQVDYEREIENYKQLDEIPDIIISAGINGFYTKAFREKFIEKKLFYNEVEYPFNELFMEMRMPDASKSYTIFTANTLVMVVDITRIGERKMPQNWGDLLRPEFEKNVAIRGKDGTFCETTLLALYQLYGIEGIRKLGKTVKYGWHPSQMAKVIGSSSKEAPLICVMPYFFTKTIKNKQNVQVVWPEEGAIVSPVTLLVKREKIKQWKEVLEFFTGPQVGQICAEACFPSFHVQVDNKMPDIARLHWVGWDFIRQHDIGSLSELLNQEFVKVFRE